MPPAASSSRPPSKAPEITYIEPENRDVDNEGDGLRLAVVNGSAVASVRIRRFCPLLQ